MKVRSSPTTTGNRAGRRIKGAELVMIPTTTAREIPTVMI